MGDKTQSNLYEAFVGEAKAHRRLLAFARKAEEEGYPQVAKLFRAISATEGVHADNHLRLLGEAAVRDTQANLDFSFETEKTVNWVYYPQFFSELDEGELAEIASRVQERTFRRGEVILLEGEAPQAVYFIVHGQVRIYRLSPEGREQVLKRLGPGEAFNFVPVLDGGPNPSSAMAWTDVTVYAIERDRFLQMVREHPALAAAILADFAAKLRHMTALAEDLSLRTVGARLAKLLLTQAAEEEAAPRRMTQQEMAAQLGTVREVIGRALTELERAGLIRMERHRIVIVDRAGLEAKAML